MADKNEPLNNPFTFTNGQLGRIIQEYNKAPDRRREEEHNLLTNALLAQLVIQLRVLAERIEDHAG